MLCFDHGARIFRVSECGCLSTPDLHIAVGTQLRDDITEGVRESAIFIASVGIL